MKVGIIHIGSFTAGSHYIIRSIIEYSIKNQLLLSGIQWNHEKDELEQKVIDKNVTDEWIRSGHPVLSSFTSLEWENNYDRIRMIFKEYDSLIVLGDNNQISKFDLRELEVRHILIPISILDDKIGFEPSVGYDTALNVVVSHIMKIQDTISSLIYDKPRVFCVQIPGKSNHALLENAALAVDGLVVYHPDKLSINQLKYKILDRNNEGKTYSVLLVNESLNPYDVFDKLSIELDIDFKSNSIDESLCMGPYPTAADRLLSIKYSQRIIGWLKGIEYQNE